MIGVISRWGAKGYGFVRAGDLETEAWLHAKFLDDPEYQPRQGDSVEFTPEKLPDGRYQARRVRLVAVPGAGTRPARSESLSPSTPGLPSRFAYAEATPGFGVKLSFAGLTLPRASLPSSPTSVAHADSNGANAGAHGPVAAADSSAPASLRTDATEAAQALPLASTAPALPDDESLSVSVRLERARAARAGRLATLALQIAEDEAALADLAKRLAERKEERSAREAGAASEDAAVVAQYVVHAALGLERGLEEKQRFGQAVAEARLKTLQRCGLPMLNEYEVLRERLREATEKHDDLAEKAFRTLERAQRATVRELAEAMDRQEQKPAVVAHFLAFADGEGTVLVAPVRAAQLQALASTRAEAARSPAEARAADLRISVAERVAIAFWHAAERAARELGPSEILVEHGVAHGSIAVRCSGLEPSLFQLPLDETWASRPTLERLEIEAAFELASGAPSGFVADGVVALGPGDEQDEDAPGMVDLGAAGPALPRTLPEAALRLGLGLHDLVALLHDRGLPFPDDVIDAGVDETLRALLGESSPSPESDAPAASPASVTPASDSGSDLTPALPLGPLGVAGRMLSKLLRDRRVGGRHTRIEHAYGHHFSDEEKDVARRVAEWLEKDGIFIPKLNEGAHHISINPRRLREIGQIIVGSWERAAELLPLA